MCEQGFSWLRHLERMGNVGRELSGRWRSFGKGMHLEKIVGALFASTEAWSGPAANQVRYPAGLLRTYCSADFAASRHQQIQSYLAVPGRGEDA